jgi:hypothetical protein
MKDNDKSFFSTLCDDEAVVRRRYEKKNAEWKTHPLGVPFERKRFLITKTIVCLFFVCFFIFLATSSSTKLKYLYTHIPNGCEKAYDQQ